MATFCAWLGAARQFRHTNISTDAGAAVEHERSEPCTKRVGVETALDLAINHDRNHTGLFRNDDGDRIVLFRQPDRRAMPRSEFLAETRIYRQRQKTGGRRHAVLQ